MDFASVMALIQGGGAGAVAYFFFMMMRDIRSIRKDMDIMSLSFNKKLYDAATGKPHYRYASECDRRMGELEREINAVGSKADRHESEIQIIKVRLDSGKVRP